MAMMTLEEIKNISFRKANIGGYRAEDVDDFIDKIEETFLTLAQEYRAEQQKAKDLDAKIVEYRSREEGISHVLLNAQRQADSVIREANQKAEIILEEAKIKAQEIVLSAQGEIDGQKQAIETLKHEVAAFKTKLLNVYREHLTLIDALPGEESSAQEEEELPAPQAEVNVNIELEQELAAESFAEEPVQEQPEEQEVPQELAQEEVIPQAEEAEQPQEEPEMKKEESSVWNNLSLFDEDYESDFTAPPSRFESLKFGDDYDMKGDPDLGSGSRKRR